jgi:hypothetical protein
VSSVRCSREKGMAGTSASFRCCATLREKRGRDGGGPVQAAPRGGRRRGGLGSITPCVGGRRGGGWQGLASVGARGRWGRAARCGSVSEGRGRRGSSRGGCGWAVAMRRPKRKVSFGN